MNPPERFVVLPVIASGFGGIRYGWLDDERGTAVDNLPEPEDIASEIMGLLQTAMAEMEALMAALNGGSSQ
ncbi:MAG: hypothetical protein K1Y36_21870 [Blastocatellia bacterium]|nr:hypothetical protein [Blastocatellia bacterium]